MGFFDKFKIKGGFSKPYTMTPFFDILLVMAAILVSQAYAAGYPSCGNTSSCFGSENGCLDLGNCNMMVSYQFDTTNKVLNVMMQSSSGLSSNSYIAMGISTDKQMGNDLVGFSSF